MNFNLFEGSPEWVLIKCALLVLAGAGINALYHAVKEALLYRRKS